MCSIAWATVVSSRTATNSGDMRRPAVPSLYSRSSWTSSDFSSSISSRISSACSLGSSSTTSTTCSGGIRSRTRDTSTSGSEPTSSRSVGSSSSASTSPAWWGLRRRKTRTWSSGGSSRMTRDTSAWCASSKRSASRSSRPSPSSCLTDSISRSVSSIPPRSMTPLRRGAMGICPAPARGTDVYLSGAELDEAQGVRHHQWHQMLGGNHAEASAGAGALGEGGHCVGAAVPAPDQEGDRLPAVAGQNRRSRVIAGDDQDVRPEGADVRDRPVQPLERLDLRVEVSVLARLVGVLVVNEEEVVRVPVLAERRELVVEGGAGLEDVHADELRETAVHRVGRDRRAPEPEDLGKPREFRQLVEAAQEHHVRGRRVGEQASGLADEAVHERRGGLRARLERLHGERRLAEHLGIGLGEPRGEAAPTAGSGTEDEDETVILPGLDEHLDAGKPDAPKALGQTHAHLGRDPARTPVGDAARPIHGAEVSARGDVARARVELDAQRLEDAAANLVPERIVAEEPEVSGAAAGSDSRRDVTDETASSLGGELREIRKPRGLELGAAGLGSREPPEPVERNEDDLRPVRDDERRDDIEHRRFTPP